MSAREELQRLVDLMSEYECGHLLSAVADISAGERFWEGGASALYNEYAKTRSFGGGGDLSSLVPAGPASEPGIFAPIPISKTYAAADRIHLPAPGRLTLSLGEIVLRRRSVREYTGGAISLCACSTLLHHVCGTTGSTSGYGYDHLPLRAFPSCGGLQVPEVYLSVQAVEHAPAGLYHYDPRAHGLELLRPGEHGRTLRALALGQPFVESAAVVFLVTGCFERLRWKYGERGYRYMCMDVGFLGQNLCLVAEALGLGACAIAGFLDDAVEQFLGVDGRDEIALLLATVGEPLRAPETKAQRAVLHDEGSGMSDGHHS